MGDTATFLLGGLVLIGVFALACWLWVRPHLDRLGVQGAGLLALIVLAFAGALGGAPAWWADQPGSFVWELPPLASRMLAAAAVSFLVAATYTLLRPTHARVRLMLLLIAVYLVPLLVAGPVAHGSRFDSSRPITYAFFGLVGLMSVASVWYLLRQPMVVADDAEDREAPNAPVRIWLILVAVVTAPWGLALFLAHDGPSDLVWAWPGDLLTSRLIAVMLLTVAAGSLASLRSVASARMMLAVALTYGAGVALASWWATLDDKPIKEGYLLGFGMIALGCGAVLLFDQLRAMRPSVEFGSLSPGGRGSG